MKIYYLWTLVLFIIVATGSLLARSFGWYNDYWYMDIILHIISGLALALLYVSMSPKISAHLGSTFLAIVSFAVFGSVLWEFWEFAGWHITPSHTQFYIPELGDTLLDIFCGLVGGVGIGLWWSLTIVKKEK